MSRRRGSPGSLRSGALAGWMGAGALVLAGASASPGGVPPMGSPTVHAEGPPLGHTGGFGEPTCQVCHAEYDLNLPGSSLSIEGWPDSYRPGERYTLTVLLDSEGMELAGFQLAVRDAKGAQAGRLEALDARVQLRDSAGVTYAHQTAGSAAVADGRTASWVLVWTAPGSGVRARVDVAANSANGDNSPFGDLVYQWHASATGAMQR